jgi:hypothetical protein
VSLLFFLSLPSLYVLPLFLVQDGQETGDILPDFLKLSCVLQLACRVLEAQVEELAPRLSDTLLKLLDVQLAHLRDLHD